MKRYIRSARSSKAYTNKLDKSLQNNIEPSTIIEDDKRFDSNQIWEIRKGLEDGVDVSIYADPKFDWRQMHQIRLGIEAGVDINLYADPKFDYLQMWEIRNGLESGVDASWYSDPKFDWRQMKKIREGLESGVDVRLYADVNFDSQQMEEIRDGLESGVDVSWYADPNFGDHQMREIRNGLESGVDISIYADPKFDWRQMKQIRNGLESGIDVSIYADPKFNWKQMQAIRRYINDPLFNSTPVEDLVKALEKDYPSLSYLGAKNKYQIAKLNWQAVKDAAASRQPLDIPALEEEFDLGTLEGRAAYTLGLDFEENQDTSITFRDKTRSEIATVSAKEFDMAVRNAIANSSTRQSFAKAFATQLKHMLDL